ncbi:Prefoldin [Flagelloscypha sp. PMI_526]|nr:Prefoldin [Flagelloscypha sp. PMI_526]
MSLPDDTLRKILAQIQQNGIVAQKNLTLTSQQIQSKDRERRIVQITLAEVGSLDDKVNVYKGVGKMFLQVPKTEMENNLKAEEKEFSDDISSLQKKSKFFEKQFSEAQGQLRDILNSAPKQS